ncbi:MAG TPA: polysaccharide biosynthesis/export family protein [Polyangia bacterium]|nr:polysaccharide biosynthesis/export family protein [Polyangia bacterium]
MRFPSSAAAALALALTLVGCATPQPYYNYANEPDPRKGGFLLGPSDVLRINVWHNPDLSGDAVVRPDGTITMPLVGDIPAAGRSPSEVRDEITSRLKAYIKDESAIVTVAVSAVNSYRFVVNGNVEKPGSYNSNHYVTVSEAITLASGPNKFASPEQTVIIRRGANGAVRRIPVDETAILTGKHPEQDLVIMPGDTVYVP